MVDRVALVSKNEETVNPSVLQEPVGSCGFWSNSWFYWFDTGSIKRRFCILDRTGKYTDRQSNRSDQPIRSNF